jgi:hypothetical protein
MRGGRTGRFSATGHSLALPVPSRELRISQLYQVTQDRAGKILVTEIRPPSSRRLILAVMNVETMRGSQIYFKKASKQDMKKCDDVFALLFDPLVMVLPIGSVFPE